VPDGTPVLKAPLVLAALLLPAGGWAAVDAPGVRAYESTEAILTYEEGPPDVNPPFDLFTASRFNYPYTLRENLKDRRSARRWRTLNLENEYLRVTVLPDLGGRLWRSIDKANGASMFYANPTLKFAQVAYRGAWATFGIEFNFPVSHSWVTSSPVDFAILTHPDGSGSIVVGNIDLVYGMQWRVELRLRPGTARLEQTTTLYNRSDVRHRFYWWTNAAVEAWDDSKLVYPMAFTATHGFTHVDTWPIASDGVDLSRPGNHLKGPVSLFSHGSREPFMGVYHPRTRTGVAHYAEVGELPARKVWSWGGDADGRDWRKALSDNDSAEVEIQAGLFRNQETYGFLEPQETTRFREMWMPVREIGGFVKVTPDAVLNLERRSGGGLIVGLNLTRVLAAGTLRVRDGPRVLLEETVSLAPNGAFLKPYPSVPPAPRYTVELRDSGGRVLLAHTEGVYDMEPRSEIEMGLQESRPLPAPGTRTADEELQGGDALEREGKLLVAFDAYEDALRRFPESFGLNRAAGRLAVALKRFEGAAALLRKAEGRVSNDAEVQYYLGCARAGLGDEAAARGHWERALVSRRLRPAALLQIGRLLARRGDLEGALDRVVAALREAPGSVRAGTFEVMLLRRLGRAPFARERLHHWRAQDPTSSALRSESVKLGGDAPALWRHLAGDPQRVIEVALDYMELGAWDDALGLLERRYPVGEGVHSEAGMPAPQEHPEVAYYRGFCRERLGGSGRADFEAASRMDTTYVFPHRAASLPVLRRALERNPRDATAHFLLGSLHLSGGLAEAAVTEWEEARRLRPELRVLHRNLGLTLLHATRDLPRALEVLREGARVDPENVQVHEALDQVLGLLGRPAEDRLAALEAYPRLEALPASLVFKRVLALVEVGRFEDAERALAGRFFPREEFGTNVRQVFVEARIQKALARARARDCREAGSLVAALDRQAPGLPFTKDGLSAFVDTARIQYLSGEVQALCGDAAAATRHWEKAATAADAYPQPNLAFALAAARHLGGDRPHAVRPRVEQALASWANRLTVGTNFPGPNACGQGLMLLALGRDEEARGKLEEALRLPDRILSHYLSRAALARKGGS
jgi:tetratricopeptide (TPR) repeat protein